MTRLLIVRLGALGDVVHALPVAAALRERWPDARIDWVVEARHAPLLDLVPAVSRRIVLEPRRLTGESGWTGVARALRAARYEAALDVQGLLKSALLARLSGAARVVGFASGHLREPAATALYTETVEPSPFRHVVDKNLGLLRALGITGASRRFPLTLPEPGPAIAEATASLGGPFVLLNGGAAWPNKRWPADRFGALARRLGERHALPSLVLWGPGEQELAASVVARADGHARPAPPTTLADVLLLARAARVMVSGDTGPLHLATAVGTPVVGIYGPTDPARNGPWADDDECVSRYPVCTCPFARRCRNPRWCLLDVSVEDVAAAAERRLARLAP